MKLQNHIGWCDATTNAVTGCDKISPGCNHCYAATGIRARVLRAQGIETWGPTGVRHPVAEMATKLRHLNKLCICDNCHTTFPVERLSSDFKSCGGYPAGPNYHKCFGDLRRIRLFADSNSDWLDEKWPIETLANFLNEIRMAPNVDVLLLTKRPENWKGRIEQVYNLYLDGHNGRDAMMPWLDEWLCGSHLCHLWLGTSVENQKYANERIPTLLQIPAAVRFLSCEPLLEGVNLVGPFDGSIAFPFGRAINWVIIGGESGKGRRDCGVMAIVNIADQCRNFQVPVYVKQDVGFHSGQQGRIPNEIWNLKQFPSVSSATSCKNPQL